MTGRGGAGALCLVVLWPALATAQPHPGGRWLTLETAHFHVHVRAEIRELGLRAAAEAEAVYAALAAELPPPAPTIELVIADNADYSNGAATEYPLPAALIYAVPPVGDIELGNYDRWLHVGLAHELAHVFELDLASGWWRVGRGVFGRMPGLFPNLYAPDWLIEGIAVYYESRLTGRGRLNGSFHRAVLAAHDAELGALPVDAAIGAGPRWPAGLRPYVFGSRFLGYVAWDWGDSVVPRLVRETARRPVPYLWLSGALRPVAGMSLSEAWSMWQHRSVVAARHDLAGAGARRGAPQLGGLRQAVAPRVSADGRRILFVFDQGKDAPRLAVLERRSGRVRTLSRLNGDPGIAWNGAEEILVSQADLTDPYTARSDLWAVGEDGAERRLTRGARLRDPDVAPDRAIVATRLEAGGTELVLSDSGIAVLAASRPGVEWAQPRFAPDGRTIAAVRAVDGRQDIVLLDRSGSVVREVTHDSAQARTPAFSGDGGWLFWSSDRDGVSQLYATRADGSTPRWRVTSEPFGAYGPAPASDSIFYLAYHHDGFALAAVALDTTQWTPGRLAESARPHAAARSEERTQSPALDSVVVAEHPYHPLPSLWPRYWLPLVQAGSGATWIGALSSGEDALQRHVYGATLSIGAGTAAGRVMGSAGYVYSRLVPWLVEASYARSQPLVDTVPGVAPVCCRDEESASLGVAWRHLRWRWQVAASAGAEYERAGAIRRAGPVLRFSASHLTAPAFAISAQDGWSLAVTARERWRTGQALEYHEARVGVAGYGALPVGGFARSVIAVRASAGALGGTERLVYGVGGIPESSLELAPGLTLGGSPRTFPVRGYGGGAILGRSAATASAELRMPLALVGRGLGLLPMYLDRMSLSLFADGGAAWFPRGFTALLPRAQTIGSLGVELAADLGAVYGTPLRLRMGAALPLTGGLPLTSYVAFGPSF